MTSNISASNFASMQALSDLSATQPIVFCQLQPIVFCQCGCKQLWEEEGAVKRLQSHLFLIINLQAYSNLLGVHCLPKLVKCCIGRCQILRVGDPPSNCCCAVILSIPSNTSTTTIMKNWIHGFMVSSLVCYRQQISQSVESFL